VYAPCTRPKTAVAGSRTRAVYTARLRPCMCTLIYLYRGRTDGRYTYRYIRVHGRVHGPCRAVYTGRVHGGTRPCTHSCTRPVSGRSRPCNGRVPACTCTCTGIYVCMARTLPLHGRVRATYMAENGRCKAAYTGHVHGSYTARSRPLRGRLHLDTCAWAVETAFTRPCTYHVHGR